MEKNKVLSFITLFLNTSVLNIKESYNLTHLPSTAYLLSNGYSYETVDELLNNYLPNNDISFFKCCSTNFIYEPNIRACVPSEKILNSNISLLDQGVVNKFFECPVIVDRLIDKRYLKILPGNSSLAIGKEMFGSGEFCMDDTTTRNVFVIRLCEEENYCLNVGEGGRENWCLHKCCPDSFTMDDYKCKLTPSKGLSLRDKGLFYEQIDGYALLHSTNLKCSIANWHQFEELKFYVKTNGQLVYMDSNKKYEIDEYCLDTMYDTDSGQNVDIVILCEFVNVSMEKWAFMKSCVIISCICLTITIIIYVFIYKLQKLLQQIIFCFCIVELLFWIMYSIKLFVDYFGTFCTTFAYMYFFISIARVTWLNVLSFEIWNMIGNPRARIGQSKCSLLKKIFWYASYATTVPTFLTLIFFMGDKKIYSLSRRLQPRVSAADCTIDTRGFDGNYGYIHLYIPVCTLIVINLMFFALTIRSFFKTRNFAKDIADAAPINKEKLMKIVFRRGCLILKLALVIGITWIYYLVAHINYNFESKPIPKIIEEVLLISNLLEGLYLFIIFVINLKTVKEILYKLHILKRTLYNNSTISNSTEFQSGIAMKSL